MTSEKWINCTDQLPELGRIVATRTGGWLEGVDTSDNVLASAAEGGTDLEWRYIEGADADIIRDILALAAEGGELLHKLLLDLVTEVDRQVSRLSSEQVLGHTGRPTFVLATRGADGSTHSHVTGSPAIIAVLGSKLYETATEGATQGRASRKVLH